MKKKSVFSRYSTQDKLLLIIGYVLLGLFVIAIVVPLIYIVVASFMDPITLQNKGITFDFNKWTTTAYERVMTNAQIWIGFKNAIIYSILFTVVSVAVTLLAAYPLSRADFKGKGFFNIMQRLSKSGRCYRNGIEYRKILCSRYKGKYCGSVGNF